MEPTEDLTEIERRLAMLQPAFAALSREKMLFEAGRASAQTKTHWGWPAATTSLFVTVLVLGMMLAGDRGRSPTVAVAPRSEKNAAEMLGPEIDTTPEFASGFVPNAELHSYLALRNEVMERGIDSVKSNSGPSLQEGSFKEKTPLRAFDRALPNDLLKNI